MNWDLQTKQPYAMNKDAVSLFFFHGYDFSDQERAKSRNIIRTKPLSTLYTLWQDPTETELDWCFQRRSRRKTKLTGFPWSLTLSVLLYS